jgi:hypothetical protein
VFLDSACFDYRSRIGGKLGVAGSVQLLRGGSKKDLQISRWPSGARAARFRES